ncbi:Hypothetical predicted protein [Xyrichtys novacula]|uniref:Uncharacterized protein n=1 Tax=Xyrichtys novacula TaxID=13765 RepID=A0AAV1HBT0_XYRNO|nr:Hypothetical predicted protein [Xyrichtys novacula]
MAEPRGKQKQQSSARPLVSCTESGAVKQVHHAAEAERASLSNPVCRLSISPLTECTSQASRLVEQPVAVNPESLVQVLQKEKETTLRRRGFNGAGLHRRDMLKNLLGVFIFQDTLEEQKISIKFSPLELNPLSIFSTDSTKSDDFYQKILPLNPWDQNRIFTERTK